jgi:spermidine synthase
MTSPRATALRTSGEHATATGVARSGPRRAEAAEGLLRLGLVFLFFASGLVTLVYEVLWARELGLLFGSTAHATATTLAIFFAGLATGAAYWGKRIAGHADPVRTYALLELGVAAAALLYFGLIDVYDRIYPALAVAIVDRPEALVLLKLLLSFTLLFPASFCIGGTLPALGEALCAHGTDLARAGSLLYAANTFGAAVGALAAGFWLPVSLGVQASYLGAIACNIVIAALAMALRGQLGRRTALLPMRAGRDGDRAAEAFPGTDRLDVRVVEVIAFASGFATLALEVSWTRMLALVLHNSVYSFSATLVGLLIALASGAALAAMLARRGTRPLTTLLSLVTLAGVTAGLSPFVFAAWTGGFGYVTAGPGWASYLGAVFAAVAVALLVPGILCGSVLPFLLGLAAHQTTSPGETLGRLAAINTAGGVAGALAAGFVLLPAVGIWGSIRGVAALYLVLALTLGAACGRVRLALAPAVALLLLTTLSDPARLPVVRLDTAKQESLHQVWETPYGIVAVLQRGDDRVIRVDNSYTLGGLASRDLEATQADLPLMIAGRPRSVFLLGLGTGITAGAALAHPVDNVTTIELVPAVVEAAQSHFGEVTNRLFTDPRSQVRIGDGRSLLRTSTERYDAIISDLFVPWHAGTGSLYSREHFTAARAHLSSEGLFAQWLPLYQLSKRELMIIARTMVEVFPQVTLWRGDFLPNQPIVALVGQDVGAELDPERLLASVRALGRHDEETDEAIVALTSLFYAGNLSAARELFEGASIHSNDRPILEYLAAITQGRSVGGSPPWLVGDELAAFYEEIFSLVPPERDPYLAAFSPEQLEFVRAGGFLFRALVAKKQSRNDDARRLRDDFDRRVPYGVFQMFRSRLSGID